MNYYEILYDLSKELTTRRFRHTQNVAATAVRLADKLGYDAEKARLAGILHDCARGMKSSEMLALLDRHHVELTALEKKQTSLLHAQAGTILAAEKYGVSDPEILQAILLHTTGGSKMTLLDRIIYLADFIEPARSFPGVQRLRELAETDFNAALLAAFDHTIVHVLAQEAYLHPATIEGRNSILAENRKE